MTAMRPLRRDFEMFEQLYGPERARGVREARAITDARGETASERSKRLRERRDELERIANAALIGGHGETVQQVTELLIGKNPSWVQVPLTTLEKVLAAINEQKRQQ